MEKVIFLITFAFLSCSLALNAQNSGKLPYNSLDTFEKQQLENAKMHLIDSTTEIEKAEVQKLDTDLRQKPVTNQTNIASQAKHSGKIDDASKKGMLLKSQLSTVRDKQNIQILEIPDQVRITPLNIK